MQSVLCVHEPRQVSRLQREPGRAHGQGSGSVCIQIDLGLTGACQPASASCTVRSSIRPSFIRDSAMAPASSSRSALNSELADMHFLDTGR